MQSKPMRIVPFMIRVSDEVLSDLGMRIRNTRWPNQAPGAAWAQGTDLEYLKRLLSYWANGFDWRAQERQLNCVGAYRVDAAHTDGHEPVAARSRNDGRAGFEMSAIAST